MFFLNCCIIFYLAQICQNWPIEVVKLLQGMQEQLESEARDAGWQGIVTRNGGISSTWNRQLNDIWTKRNWDFQRQKHYFNQQNKDWPTPGGYFSQQTGGYFTKENRDTHNKHLVPNYGIEGMI